MLFLGTLIKRELLENLQSSRYALTNILCVALCITSIVLMSHDYTYRLKRFNLRHYTYGQNTIAKPPMPLSLIAKGVDEVIGRPALPQAPHDYPIAFVYNYYGEERHLFDLFTVPDFVYVVSVVLSALAIFLSFDAICGEKETHTLSLILSNSVPRSTLLLAKWIAGYTSFLISLVPALLLMIISLILLSGVPLQTEHWIRLGILIILSLAYLSVFFTFGMFISTLTHRSATALVLVLCIWAIWALGVPRFGSLAARAIKPVQMQSNFRQEKRRVAENSRNLTRQQLEKLWQMDDAYIAALNGQIEMGQHLSRVSPLSSYIYASTTLAQTGISDLKDYWRSASHWNRERFRKGETTEFVYPPLELEQSLSLIVIDVALLIVWNLLLFLSANLVFLRYDVR